MQRNQAFIRLAECSQKKCVLENKQIQSGIRIKELQHQELETQESLHKAEQAVRDFQKKIHALDIELKSLEAQEKEKNQRLLFTSNAKEYESLFKELVLIGLKKVALEEEIFSCWSGIEKCQEQLKVLEPHVRKDLDKIRNELQRLQDEHGSLTHEIDTLEIHCADLLHFMNAEIKEQYIKMLKVMPNPAVVIEGNSCSGCFSSIPGADLGRAEKGEIVRCRDCSRFLYYPNGHHE